MTVDTERSGLSIGLRDDTALGERAEALRDDSGWAGEGQGTGTRAFGRPLVRVPTSADEDTRRRAGEALAPRSA